MVHNIHQYQKLALSSVWFCFSRKHHVTQIWLLAYSRGKVVLLFTNKSEKFKDIDYENQIEDDVKTNSFLKKKNHFDLN